MEQSKQNSQYKQESWIQKTNFMGQFLSEKSNEIIKKIQKKYMKSLIFSLLFLPFFVNAQYGRAIKFQNTVRSYYNMQDLSSDRQLRKQAQAWANYIAEQDELLLSTDIYGETLYRFNKRETMSSKNYFLDAAVAWFEAYESPEYYQQLCYSCTEVGFGIAESNEYIYVVAKYDKIYD